MGNCLGFLGGDDDDSGSLRRRGGAQSQWRKTGVVVLRSRGLSVFPINDEEEDLSSVRVVDASHNEISELPSALRQMASVSRVNFSENKLHQVDLSVIKDLSKLKDLNLSGNSISKLSFSSDWKPLALDTLRLGRNSLDSITPSLFACGILSRLKILDISENGLASLPETVAELKSLEDLNLEGNFLTALPDSLGELKSLRVLRLRNNQIKLISREILVGCTSLKIMDYENNPIDEILLQETEGYKEFERRHKSLVDKQLDSRVFV